MQALRESTTLRVGGIPEAYLSITDTASLSEARNYLRTSKRPYAILGGGSNVLAAEEIKGVILRNAIEGITYVDRVDEVIVRAGGGVRWDDLVADTVREGYWGLENLSGIPGTVGAAPIQNVGAYGVEVAQSIEYVEFFDLESGGMHILSNKDCAFGYRTSIFSREARTWFITSVSFRLSKSPLRKLTYVDLAKTFVHNTSPSIQEVRDAVLHIRSQKFPDSKMIGSAGSFFKNLLISSTEFTRLRGIFSEIPGHELSDGRYKVPLAYILEALGYRGVREGNVGLYERQPLVLITYPGARADAVDIFARNVERSIFDKTGFHIEREVKKFPHFSW